MEYETLDLETEIFEELVALRRTLKLSEYSSPDTFEKIEHGIETYLFGPQQ